MKHLAPIILMCVVLVGCSSYSEPPEPTPEPTPIEHNYYNVGDTVDTGTFKYIVHSVKESPEIPVSDGLKWLVLDVTLEDTLGDEDGYTYDSHLYAEFVLLDDEDNIYKSYFRENKTTLYGSVRDIALFKVPVSKSEFKMFDDGYLFEGLSDFDMFPRDIVNIKINGGL